MPEVAPAMAAYLGVRRRREKASSVAMRRLQSTSIANQDSAVVQAMAMDAAASQCVLEGSLMQSDERVASICYH